MAKVIEAILNTLEPVAFVRITWSELHKKDCDWQNQAFILLLTLLHCNVLEGKDGSSVRHPSLARCPHVRFSTSMTDIGGLQIVGAHWTISRERRRHDRVGGRRAMMLGPSRH